MATNAMDTAPDRDEGKDRFNWDRPPASALQEFTDKAPCCAVHDAESDDLALAKALERHFLKCPEKLSTVRMVAPMDKNPRIEAVKAAAFGDAPLPDDASSVPALVEVMKRQADKRLLVMLTCQVASGCVFTAIRQLVAARELAGNPLDVLLMFYTGQNNVRDTGEHLRVFMEDEQVRRCVRLCTVSFYDMFDGLTPAARAGLSDLPSLATHAPAGAYTGPVVRYGQRFACAANATVHDCNCCLKPGRGDGTVRLSSALLEFDMALSGGEQKMLRDSMATVNTKLDAIRESVSSTVDDQECGLSDLHGKAFDPEVDAERQTALMMAYRGAMDDFVRRIRIAAEDGGELPPIFQHIRFKPKKDTYSAVRHPGNNILSQDWWLFLFAFWPEAKTYFDMQVGNVFVENGFVVLRTDGRLPCAMRPAVRSDRAACPDLHRAVAGFLVQTTLGD